MEDQFDKRKQRRRKALLTLMLEDIKSSRTMVNNPDTWNTEYFRCHIEHVFKNGGDLLTLLEPQLNLDLDVTVHGMEVHSQS